VNIVWMMIGIPAAAGAAAFLLPWRRPPRALLPAAALAHAACVARAWIARSAGHPPEGAWFALDAPGLLFLTIASLLFLAASWYATGYLEREGATSRRDAEEGFLFVNQPAAVFSGCLLLFLAMMTLVCTSRHLGMLWVAIEATTLASAPPICFHRHHRSLEAAWKYLLICSVGIALALLGTFFLVAAAGGAAPEAAAPPSLLLADLAQAAPRMAPLRLKTAFVLLLVGYGTKAGLAPMHNWLPDAHSEAPSVVSALLSGALLNCALLGVLRAAQICARAGEAAFAQGLLLALGLASVAVAAVFIPGQRDYKRLLAYSSVEHMGLATLGIGLGGAAAVGGLLHAVNHSLTKAALFLVAGNILAACRTKNCAEVRGLRRSLPVSGALWLAGFFALAGMPPFGLFVSKFAILRGAFAGGGVFFPGLPLLVLLAAVFIGMCALMPRMTQGEPAPPSLPRIAEAGWSIWPPLLLALGTLLLGIWLPAPLMEVLREAAALTSGGGG
jgi:hydrogenase-4 component F